MASSQVIFLPFRAMSSPTIFVSSAWISSLNRMVFMLEPTSRFGLFLMNFTHFIQNRFLCARALKKEIGIV